MATFSRFLWYVVNRLSSESQFLTTLSVYVTGMFFLTDYGRPMKPFFIKIRNSWAWADKFWGVWGIFQFISNHFGTVN